MLTELVNGRFVYYVMGALCVLAVISKLTVWISYKRLVKASMDMAASKNTLTRQLKLKFENCYKLNLNVQNIPVFVDKYLRKYKLLGMRVHTLHRLSNTALLLEVLFAFGGSVICYINGQGTEQVVRYAATCVLMALGLLVIEMLMDVSDKRGMVETNLQDYLDNVLNNRLRHEYEADATENLVDEQQVLDLAEKGRAQTAAAKLKIRKWKKGKPAAKPESEEEAVIREILREFLT